MGVSVDRYTVSLQSSSFQPYACWSTIQMFPISDAGHEFSAEPRRKIALF